MSRGGCTEGTHTLLLGISKPVLQKTNANRPNQFYGEFRKSGSDLDRKKRIESGTLERKEKLCFRFVPEFLSSPLNLQKYYGELRKTGNDQEGERRIESGTPELGIGGRVWLGGSFQHS